MSAKATAEEWLHKATNDLPPHIREMKVVNAYVETKRPEGSTVQLVSVLLFLDPSSEPKETHRPSTKTSSIGP